MMFISMISRLNQEFRLQNIKLACTYWLIAYFISFFLNGTLWVFVSPIASMISVIITTPILMTFLGIRYLKVIKDYPFYEGIKLGIIWFLMSVLADILSYFLFGNGQNDLDFISDYSYWFIVPYFEVLAGGIVAGLINKNINNRRMRND